MHSSAPVPLSKLLPPPLTRHLRHPPRPILREELALRRQRVRLVQAPIKEVHILTRMLTVLEYPRPAFATKFASKVTAGRVVALMDLGRGRGGVEVEGGAGDLGGDAKGGAGEFLR